MKITIDASVFECFPKLNVTGLIASNIQAEKLPTYPDCSHISLDSQLDTKSLIKQWKAAYKQFPTDKKARASIEYLIWAFEKEKLRQIHPLVDLYNQASLLALAPFGGEDIDCIGETLSLTAAKGTEIFIPLGKTEPEHPKEQEIVWAAGEKVVCRSLNWLESDLFKITDNSKNIVFVSERPSEEFPDPQQGMELIQSTLQTISNRLVAFKLDANNNEFIF